MKEQKTIVQNYKVPKQLLSKGSNNAKTAKNVYPTYILYMAPYTQNYKGINLCPKASKGCAAACLFTAGRGKFSNVMNSRINKANYFVGNKKAFIWQLAAELVKINRLAKETTLIRLNGTTDVDFVYLLKKYSNLNISDLTMLKFYDYTKVLQRAIRYKNHSSYKVTFSRSEDNEKECLQALKQGINIAAVFSGHLPTTYKGFKVVDGDISDNEMLYYRGVILGLKAKGEAKKDDSNFVIKTEVTILN